MTAPDHCAPYAIRLQARPAGVPFADPSAAVSVLLEEIGTACLTAGASLIGHLKCLIRTDAGERFYADLTDMRSGAHVSGTPIASAHHLDVDLVVLVYGLKNQDVAAAVDTALIVAGERTGIVWNSA